MGAWIEIRKIIISNLRLMVAPHMGAWIEIPLYLVQVLSG